MGFVASGAQSQQFFAVRLNLPGLPGSRCEDLIAMINAAFTSAAAVAVSLVFAASPCFAAAPGHHRASGVEHPLVAPYAETAPTNSFYGQIGTGATARGTAGGGTFTTNRAGINASSFGLLPSWARTDSGTTPTGTLVTAPGFATAPAHVIGAEGAAQQQAGAAPQASGAALVPSAFQPIPAGALGTAVRDHSLPASPNAPAPGGYYRPNSVPSTDVGVRLQPYHASPDARSMAGDTPHHEADAPARTNPAH